VVLRFATICIEQLQARCRRKQKVRALELHTHVIQRGRGVAGFGLLGKPAGADHQTHQVGGFGVHQKRAVIAGNPPAIPVMAPFKWNPEAEFGRRAAVQPCLNFSLPPLLIQVKTLGHVGFDHRAFSPHKPLRINRRRLDNPRPYYPRELS